MQVVYSLYCLSFGICVVSSNSIFDFLRSKRQTRCIDKFRCNDGQCIESFEVCDGTRNCRDGTDETQAVCSNIGVQCPAYAFRCAYGACVDRTAKCDGKPDCADNSDELLPECRTSTPTPDNKCRGREFACLSGQCIDEFSVCDGIRDCDDGTDETITQCVNIRCPAFSFQCAYGACIDKNKQCNSVDDCSDGSDEDPELCSSFKPKPSKPKKPKPVTTPAPIDGCILPDKSDESTYKVVGCDANDRSQKCRSVPGTLVPVATVLTYSCAKGYVLPEHGKNTFCLNGAWDPEPPQCLKLCKPLVSDSMDLECFYRGEPVTCNQQNRPGTKVKPKCKQAFHVNDPSTSFKETDCLADGTWDIPLFRCVPDCGKANRRVEETLISYGSTAKVSEYPWHAGLYRQERGEFILNCGGTIISPHIVVTAAHCIYDETASKIKNASEMRIAVGKYKRQWEYSDSFEQRIPVKEIIPQRAYRGKSNSYEQDIAVLDLVFSIRLSNNILPACIDWLKEGVFEPGVLGTVVGWGVTETGAQSEELRVATLPYFDYESCRRRSPPEFLRFITYDKFCAGYSNGTGVQPGDSGGGLTFPRHGLHFLYGIVSLKPKDQDTFAAFTNVSDHIEWLQGVVKALKPHHNA